MTKGKFVFIGFLVVVLLGSFGLFAYAYQSFVEKRDAQENSNSALNGGKTLLSNFLNNSKCSDWKAGDCAKKITFLQVNQEGKRDNRGQNFAVVFDPKSSDLEFKVNVPLSNAIYQKQNEKLVKNYISKNFSEMVTDQNALLEGKKPIAAINADYIDEKNNPQGYNVSRGVEYSGDFKNIRSSFSISGGEKTQRKATIQIGPRKNEVENYNAVGGNGRFYTNGVFEDICTKLGEYACRESTNRSMAAITKDGFVIFLVHQSSGEIKLLPSQFDDILSGITTELGLGGIQDAMLFDGGKSPGIMFESKIYVQNPGPIGSVFLIY